MQIGVGEELAMFGSGSRGSELFANRFEPDGDGFLFRANIRAPGIRVSAAERDRFVTEFTWRIRVATWGLSILSVLLLVGALLWADSRSGWLAKYSPYIVVAATLVPFLAFYMWQWNAPVRALSTRMPVANERSKDEGRRLAFRRITWGQLGLAAVMVPVLLLRFGARSNLLSGWNRLWLVAAGVFLVLVGIQAIRKWRVSRLPAPDAEPGPPRQ
jgi:hypothetical protein